VKFIERGFAVNFLVGLAGLEFSIAEEMFSLCSEIRVKSDIVMIVMQNKVWDYRMDRGVLGSKKSSYLIRF
jgi:hypothetical protein